MGIIVFRAILHSSQIEQIGFPRKKAEIIKNNDRNTNSQWRNIETGNEEEGLFMVGSSWLMAG